MVIDGQQRLTTTLLTILAVARFAKSAATDASTQGDSHGAAELQSISSEALSVARLKADCNTSQDDPSNPSCGASTGNHDKATDTVNLKELSLKSGPSAQPSSRLETHGHAGIQLGSSPGNLGTVGSDPPSLDDCRCLSLVPSLGDRSLLLLLTLSTSPSWTALPASAAKAAFERLHRNLEKLCMAATAKSSRTGSKDGHKTHAGAILQNLRRVMYVALEGISVMSVQLDSSSACTSFQQVYLWLEEKAKWQQTCFSVPKSSAPLRMWDLARNLFLAPLLATFSSTSLIEQERCVRELWWPIESFARMQDPDSLKQLLTRFAQHHDQEVSSHESNESDDLAIPFSLHGVFP